MSPRLAGFAVAAATLVADQANKLFLLDVYDIEIRQPVRLGPYFDIVMARNPGISYSLLSARSAPGDGVSSCSCLWQARSSRGGCGARRRGLRR